MSDPTDNAADHLDDRLNADGPGPPGDDLAGFAHRLVRQAALPSEPQTTLSGEQRDHIRRKVFGETPSNQQARTPMHAATTVTTLPTVQPQRPHHPEPSALSILMTAAIVAIIAIASFGLLRGSIDFFPNGNGSGPSQAPGFLDSATPALESPDGCPLTNDILLFVGEAPTIEGVDGLDPTLAIIQPDGDFVIICGEAENPEPLLTGVADALPLLWPGTVLLETHDGSGLAYNVATGEQVDVGEYERASRFLGVGQSSPSWLVSPNNDALTDWRITNLEQMSTFVLSDEMGGVLEDAQIPTIETAYGSPTAMISFDGSLDPLGGPPFVEIDGIDSIPANPEDAKTAELPARGLIVDETFDTRRWIDIEGQMAVSADGEAIAYQTRDGDTTTLRIEAARTGDVLAEFGDIRVNRTSESLLEFAGDGESLVWLDANDIWLATYGEEPTTTLLDTGDMRPAEVHATGVPGRLLIQRIIDGNVGSPGAGLTVGVSILDTTNLEVLDVEGLLTGYSFGTYSPWEQLEYVVTRIQAPESVSRTVMQVTEIRSGEPVLTSESLQTLIEPSVAVRSDRSGMVTVVSVSDDEAVYFDVRTGTSSALSLESLHELGPEVGLDWNIFPSSDGHFLVALGTVGVEASQGLDIESPSPEVFFAVAPASRDPEWSVPSSESPIGPIVGVSPPVPQEPATLDAQEITPLPASPVATPATPIASNEGCDLSQDVPLVSDLDAVPWDRTMLWLSDDTAMATAVSSPKTSPMSVAPAGRPR